MLGEATCWLKRMIVIGRIWCLPQSANKTCIQTSVQYSNQKRAYRRHKCCSVPPDEQDAVRKSGTHLKPKVPGRSVARII